MESEISIRQMEPTDGQAIAALLTRSPDAGRFAIASRHHLDPYQAMQAMHPGTVGVVAVESAANELIGMGQVQLGRCGARGEQRPYALLSDLVVHPNWRQQGIAYRLTQWRIAYVQREMGAKVVLVAIIQNDNAASIATAKAWSHQIFGQLQTALVRVRDKRPKPLLSIEIRIAVHSELEIIAHGLNRFYDAYELYSPETAVSLTNWLHQSPFDEPIRHYYVAINQAGEILAGAAITEQCKVTTMHVQRMPGIVHFLNKAVKMVPEDGVLRQVGASKLWFAPEQEQAGRYLWETVRWTAKDKGSHLVCTFDPRGALPEMLRIPFWLPKATFQVAVGGGATIDAKRLLYAL